ncbi:MAG: hypothetical protein LWW85_02305 [Marinilabiliales bacterium]|nr:hypothetical protein [Marinilabiliales bacterium]
MKAKDLNRDFENRFPKRETGFTVPEGYFATFEDRLKLPPIEGVQGKGALKRMHYMRPFIGIAASLAILMTVYRQFTIRENIASNEATEVKMGRMADDASDSMTSTYATMISDGQFFAALNEMDEFDTSKMPKEALADYLASNCSDSEIVNGK